MALNNIKKAGNFHAEFIKPYSTHDQRTIGFVLQSEKIEVPYEFTKDWALILRPELYTFLLGDRGIDFTRLK